MAKDPPVESAPGHERDLIRQAKREAARLPDIPSAHMPPADSFTGYEIKREIHRGGQGAVYQAIQNSTQQKVAIKVMKEGPFASQRDKVRFDREVRILAKLKHPHIVAIHDSGTAAGHFFFVMDYIAGQPLDLWSSSGQRSVEETLELFTQICEAVNVAHLRGIIHRDLKPGNILITSDGEPRILDFGLAKLAQGSGFGETTAPAVTVSGQFVGSLPWATPEQARGTPGDIDVRTDVYALGVILYQMLTGKFPYEVFGSMHDVLGNIMSATPIRPRSLRREINDEVETIVLKCLDKERERRYQSAGELARDIRHYLAGEPIDAKRDSSWYVLRKTLVRYKIQTAVISGFILLSMVAAVAGWIAYRGAAERVWLQQQADSRNAALVKMTDRFIPMAQAVEDPMKEETPGLAELQENVRWADENLNDIPEYEAKLRTTIGLGYHKLGMYAAAEVQLSSALAARQRAETVAPEELADSHHNLARPLFWMNEFKEAQTHYARAMEIHVQVSGADSAEVLASLNGVASCLYARGEYREAERRFREALRMRMQVLGEEDDYTLASMNNLAKCLQDRGRFDEAEQLFRRAVAKLEERGGRPLFIARSWRSVALCHLARGQTSQALKLLDRELLRVQEATQGVEHPELGNIYYELACCFYEGGRLEQAKRRCQEALEMQRKTLPERHTRIAASQLLLARIYLDEQDLSAAEQFLDATLPQLQKLLEPNHPNIAAAQCEVARLHLARQRAPEAQTLCEMALVVQSAKLDATHPAIASTLQVLGEAMLAQRQFDAAEAQLRRALDIRNQLLSENHWRVAEAQCSLGACLSALGRYSEAEALLIAALAVFESKRGADSHDARRARDRLVDLYRNWNKPEKAAQLSVGE